MSEHDDETLPPLGTIPVDLEVEMKRSYLDYAMSVIVGRALPDVRDGLKPVHRRVLYGMWEASNYSNRAYKKSARIVGDVMGKYHPHGDSAIYDTVVRLAQDFSMRYPLVDGQGNFGSLDGDNAAAMRYTEVRMTKLAEEMLRDDIDKETVEWIENYDGSEREPMPLPARFPNLLVNGSSGIAVGMATNIPPHNLTEVVNAAIQLIDNPDVESLELMESIPGPDFPTGGSIHGSEGIRSAYATGRGTIKVRAKAHFEHRKGDRQSIIVDEIPYQVNKARLIEKMAELVRDKKIEGISDLRDESDRNGIRMVIDLKRGEVPEVILNTLYKMTQMQVSFGMNMLAIVDGRPQTLSLRELLFHFLNHRKTVVIRRSRYDLRKAEERAHILEGLLKALDHLDEVITTIRSSQTPLEARERLISTFGFSEPQAQAILDMRLQRLTGLEREKILEEYQELMKTIERLRSVLNSDELVLEVIRGELLELQEKYGDARRTEILAHTGDISIEDMIADEDMVITVTNSGYIKRSPLALYRAQNRGGKGRKGMETKEEDFVENVFIASAHSYILAVTERGRLYWIKVHGIPEFGPAARGKAIVNLLNLNDDERIATTIAVREFPEDRYLTFSTEGGTIKKTSLAAYSRPRADGIIAARVDDDDRLLAARVTDGERDIVLATARGYSVRFPETDVRPLGRVTRGVRGINLRKGDRVVSMESLERGGDLLTLTEKGYGKRTVIDEYRRQGRGGMGIINLKVSDKTGEVIAAKEVVDDGIVIITHEGKIIRIESTSVSTIGRATQGVKIMDLDGDDRLVAAARVPAREDDELDPDPESDPENDPEGDDEEPVDGSDHIASDDAPDDADPGESE